MKKIKLPEGKEITVYMNARSSDIASLRESIGIDGEKEGGAA